MNKTLLFLMLKIGVSAMVLTHGFVSASPALAATQPAVIFEQPLLTGVAGNFFVPPAIHKPPPVGAFSLILWQPNPNQPDGMLVPTNWSAGNKTGFYPTGNLVDQQAGFENTPGITTVQIGSDTVGAYINSRDLPSGSHQSKMMITPQYTVPPANRMSPFLQQEGSLVMSLEVQIPTATNGSGRGSNTYASADLQFIDKTTGSKISYGCGIFFNGHPNTQGHVGFDEDSKSIMVNSPIAPENPWLTLLPGSSTHTGSPWKGWRLFAFAITKENFQNALAALKQEYPTANVSMNPADYVFSQFHLNAELHFQTAPAELGWSMRNARIQIED